MTHIFLCKVEQMVLGVEHVVLRAGDDDDAIVLVLGEADVHLILVHHAPDVLPAEPDEPPVHARLNLDLLAVLTVL